MYKSKCIVKNLGIKALIYSFVHSFIQGGFVVLSVDFWYRSIMILQFTLRTESRHLTKYINLRKLSIIDGLMNAPLKKG